MVSSAAELSLNNNKNIFTPKEEFLVQVYLNTESVLVNAVEGTIIYPSDFVELKEIRDGNSVINFWVERPSTEHINKVVFSGITAGGFSGSKKFLFSMVFKAKTLGEGVIDLNNVQILANDGEGTKVSTNLSPFRFSILEDGGGLPTDNLLVIDNEPPEDFLPFVAKDPTIYDGKYFIVFSAIDKGVGIDHFEIREGVWSDYVVAKSPYLLSDQSLTKDIRIQAIDKKGNKRLVKIKAQNPSFGLEEFLIIGIILVLCFYFYKKIWGKYVRS